MCFSSPKIFETCKGFHHPRLSDDVIEASVQTPERSTDVGLQYHFPAGGGAATAGAADGVLQSCPEAEDNVGIATSWGCHGVIALEIIKMRG